MLASAYSSSSLSRASRSLFPSFSFSAYNCCAMLSDRFRLRDSPLGSRERADAILSRALPKRAWVHLTAARAAGRTLVVSDKLCAMSVLLWGFQCTEWVDGPPDLSLLRYRHGIDSRERGVYWPSAQDVLCCSVSLPRRRYCLGFCRKRGNLALYSHTTPAVLNLREPRYCPDSQRSEVIWPSVQAEVPFIKYSLLVDYGWCKHIARLAI